MVLRFISSAAAASHLALEVNSAVAAAGPPVVHIQKISTQLSIRLDSLLCAKHTREVGGLRAMSTVAKIQTDIVPTSD